MYGNTIRSLPAALALAAAVGFSQAGMATETDPEEETEQSSEEEAPAPSLESLLQDLADALATLRRIEEQLAALKQAQAEAQRKLLALSLAPGLSRSTETPVYSVKAGEKAIAAAEDASDAVRTQAIDLEAGIAYLEAEIAQIEATLAAEECVSPCTLNDELAALRTNLESARADLHAAQAAVAEAETELARRIANPGTLAVLLPNPDVRFAPLTAALRRDFQQTRVAVTDDAHVKAVSSDGEGGFHLTYVIGSVEQAVHFEASDFDSNARQYRKQDGSASLWSYTNSFTRPDTNRNQGSTEFKYFDAHGSWNRLGYSLYMTYGARTEYEGLPAGIATYAGRMSADSFSRDNPSINTGRSYFLGRLNLTADFEDGTVEGRINRIWVRRPGASGFTALPDTTLFDIESGRIGNGQFTATLKGDDSDENASADQTVLGYEGDILGEFYGPAAEEVGGVLNAVSDKHNSVLSGWFGGRQLGSVVPEGASSPPSSVGVERDIVASTVQAADDSGVTAISSDGESGYNVTYTIDGVEHAVHLLGSDYGANPRYFTSYERDTGTQRYSLYSPLDSFFGTSEYDHFDVAGWVTVRDSDDGSGDSEYVTRGFLVHGARTETVNLPAGEASYAGRMVGGIWKSDDPEVSSRTSVKGNLSLTADFLESTISGMIDGIETRGPDQSSYQTSNEELTISGGSIADSTFTADLTGTGDEDSRYEGDVSGQFFGPAAEEVGGVLEATHTGDSTILTGWFGGKRDDIAVPQPATAQ